MALMFLGINNDKIVDDNPRKFSFLSIFQLWPIINVLLIYFSPIIELVAPPDILLREKELNKKKFFYITAEKCEKFLKTCILLFWLYSNYYDSAILISYSVVLYLVNSTIFLFFIFLNLK